MRAWTIVGLAIGLVSVGIVVLSSSRFNGDEGGAADTGEDVRKNSSKEVAPTKTFRENALLQEQFSEIAESLAQEADPRYREGIHRVYFEVRACLKLLRRQRMPEALMNVSEDLYERLEADPSKGYPKRSAQVFGEVKIALKELKEDYPDNYQTVLAIALLRAAYPEVRSTGAGNGGPEYAFQKQALEEASVLTGENFYTGPDDSKRFAEIAAFGKKVLGVE